MEEESIEGVTAVYLVKEEEEESEESVEELTETSDDKENGQSTDNVLQDAHTLIDTFTQKLGSNFQLDNSVAHELLKKIASSRSGNEALQQLDQLVAILEDLLAELNALTLIGRYTGNTPVLVTEAEAHTVTIFDSHSIPLEDEELLTMEQESTKVKQDLVDFASRKHRDLALSLPSNK